MEKLPVEILCHIALLIDDTESLRSFCAAERRMLDTFQSLHFRIKWLTQRHPNFAALFSPNKPRVTKSTIKAGLVTKELEYLSAQVLADSNALNVTLSITCWRSYFECWLRQFSERKLPILPGDANIRNALVIHAWKDVIPSFIRNQLLPPFGSDISGLGVREGRIGPDYEKVFNWFLIAIGRDDDYMNNYHGGQAVTTENVLPEGLIDATNYAWLMDVFRLGWVDKLMEMTFDGIEPNWVHWLHCNGEKGVRFNKEGLAQFMFKFRRLVDP